MATLAAGELVRFFLELIGHADLLKGIQSGLPRGGGGFLVQLEGVFHVLQYGHIREQGVVLEDNAHAALKARQPGDILPALDNFAAVCGFQADENAQQGGFAAAADAENRKELALIDVEGDVVQDLFIVKAFAELPHLQLFVQYFHRLSSLSFSSGSSMPVISAYGMSCG